MRQESKKPPLWLFFCLAAGVIVIWVCNLLFLYAYEPDQRGTYGDMFGAANAIFSGLAFAGVVYAIFLQSHEVDLTKQDLERTKVLLTEQQKSLEEQNRNSRKQSFETTFFQLLTLLTEITSAVDLRSRGGSAGKDAMRFLLNRLNWTFSNYKGQEGTHERLRRAYDEMFNDYDSELGHYFRTLYNIVKFVDSSEVQNKKFYTNILRAQLSDAEAALLFYNCLTRFGEEKFKPLVEKYALLKNVSVRNTFSPDLRELYSPSAFA